MGRPPLLPNSIILLAFLLAACQPASLVVERKPDLTPSTHAVATSAPIADRSVVKVRFFFDNEPSKEWATKLPMLWRAATIDRSRLVVGNEGILIVVTTTPGRTTGGGGLINITPPYRAVAFLHELGHTLGCCYGPGTSAGHFISGPPGIMSDPVCADCLLFSEREMEGMGLGSKE